MNLEEFEHQVLAGEITDFEPYFEDKRSYYHLRCVLAKLGIEVDRIIEMDGPGTILGFIQDKVHIDRYEEWKNHPLADVRKALARAGYFHNELIHDPEAQVRRVVIEHDMHQGLKRLHDKEDRKNIKFVLENSVNPDVDLLAAYIDVTAKCQNTSYPSPALKLKLKGMCHVPTAIEKTMSEEQLFKTDCPLWTKPYTANRILDVIVAQRNLTKRGFVGFNKALYEALKISIHEFHKESLEELTIEFQSTHPTRV